MSAEWGVDVDMSTLLDTWHGCEGVTPLCHFTAARCFAQDSSLSEVCLYAFGIAYTIYTLAYFSPTMLKSVRPPFPRSSRLEGLIDLEAAIDSIESSCVMFGPSEMGF